MGRAMTAGGPPVNENAIEGMEAAEYAALLAEHEVSMLQERVAELEFAREDVGWDRMDEAGSDDVDLSPGALRRIIRDARAMTLKNPLIDHAVSATAHYVFGQGVAVSGRGLANDRVQAFLADRGNLRSLTSQQALLGADRQLTYEGNVFLACFSPPDEVTRVRRIPTLQIVAGDIIRNPDDDAEVWYYKRVWTRRGEAAQRIDYYPDLFHTPTRKPATWGEGNQTGPIAWDAPVVHVRDGGLTGARFGVPTVFSSLDWARAVSRDLSDYATVRRALARFAWRVVTKSRAGAAAVHERLNSTVTAQNGRERNPAPTTGSAFVGVEGTDIQPLRTAGAAASPEEGRRLWLMVSAGTGIPETILSGNADAGSYATAKTLDRPTELMMRARQSVWADAITDIVAYDLRRGRKDGKVPEYEDDPTAEPTRDAITGLAVAVVRAVKIEPDVTFPDILEEDVTARVGAIVAAATLGAPGATAGTIPDALLTRLLLSALAVEDADEVIADMYPPTVDGEEVPEPVDPMDPDLMMGDPSAALPPPPEAQFAEALDAFAARIAAGDLGAARVRRPRPSRARRGGDS